MNEFMNCNFNITKIDLACFVPGNSGSPVHKNRSYHGLAFFTCGDTVFNFGNNLRLHVRSNEIIYLPKNSSYTVERITPGDCYAINFDILNKLYSSPFVHKTKNYASFFRYFKDAEKSARSKFNGYEMKCKALLYNIIGDMMQEFHSGYISQSKARIIQPALEYIHNEYTEKTITVPYLSHLCNISEIYFRKLFRQIKGVSPVKYINTLRIERARELLSMNMYTVGNVSELSGFNDESYFSREFKKYTGLSPLEYAKTNQNQQ